ncbi:MAG: hypothetical protein COA32_06455 [Fluviicola sp.]|nr:MAG: hypothetical protein COA32_06455 [Fluviicola sp.]
MKSLITISILLLSLSVLGQQQYIGLKGGRGWTNYYADGAAGKYDYRTGLNMGLTYEYELKNNFHLEVDLLYAQKSFIIDGYTIIDGTIENTVTNFDHYFESEYISIPIKVGYSVGNKLQSFFNVGVVPSVLVRARETTIKSGEYGSPSNRTDQTNRIDFGGITEIGVSYTIKEEFKLFTSFNYQQSFNPITDVYFENPNAKHYGMILSIGVKYRIGE